MPSCAIEDALRGQGRASRDRSLSDQGHCSLGFSLRFTEVWRVFLTRRRRFLVAGAFPLLS
jgi:hypothetical protein